VKRCSKCGIEKPTSSFYKRPTSADRLQRACKDCDRDRIRQRNWKPDSEIQALIDEESVGYSTYGERLRDGFAMMREDSGEDMSPTERQELGF
jgi:hypothetical protein